MVDELHNLYRCFSGRVALLLVDQVDDIEIEGEIRAQDWISDRRRYLQVGSQQ